LHHFTNPLWFVIQGGWEDRKCVDYFLRFVSKVVEALAEKVNYWVTINEPMVYVYQAYILGVWPPQEKSFSKAKIARDNLVKAHIRAYELIHRTYRGKKLPRPLVSIAKNVQHFQPCRPSLKNKIASYARDKSFNFGFVEILARNKSLDFIGLNYYTRSLVDVRKWALKNLLLDNCSHSALKKNSLGWDIFPEGLFNLLLRFRKYNLPLFILENGICTEDDNQRWSFICEHLKEIHRAMQQGAKVMGYIYWSLLDNFEWDKGFGHRFGLVEVDYRNYKRAVRESARKFSLVSKTGALE